jgi:hypothetical protein
MFNIGEIFSVFKESLPLFTACGVTLSAAGLTPRLGPGRAIWIALRSRFAYKPNPQSLRNEEIGILRRTIAQKELGQEYFVVTGENGVGKTCFVKTVTSKTPGVITVYAQPSDNGHTIIGTVLNELTGLNYGFCPPFHSAKRVVFWHRVFTLGRFPIVIINATEGNLGQKCTDLTSAVRILVEKYKLRVIVDASPNSLNESLLRTGRQHVFDIKPMAKEMIWQIDQLQDLFKYSKEADLDDILFAVLGGIPRKYEKLWGNANIALEKGENPRKVIGFHLCAEISAAIDIVEDSRNNTFDHEKNWILRDNVKNLRRASPGNVFRDVTRNGMRVLFPASNAIGIVLKHNLTAIPSLHELEELLRRC